MTLFNSEDDMQLNVSIILDQTKTFWRSKKTIGVTVLEHTPTSQSTESSPRPCIEVIAFNLKGNAEAPHLYFDSQKIISNARDKNMIQKITSSEELAKTKYGKQLMASYIFDRINIVDDNSKFEVCLLPLLSDQFRKVSHTSMPEYLLGYFFFFIRLY
jgi:hypothetical protein